MTQGGFSSQPISWLPTLFALPISIAKNWRDLPWWLQLMAWAVLGIAIGPFIPWLYFLLKGQ